MIDKIIFHYQQLFKADIWNIGIIDRPIHTLLENDIKENEVKWVSPSTAGEYIADPFALQVGDKLQVYYEHYNYKNRKGKICSIEFENNEWRSSSKTILEENHHFSYPYLVEYENDIYCLPETAKNNQVDLYQYDEETNKLQFVKTLLENTSGVDPTLFHHNGYWWLFCTLLENTNSQLCVYYSENFLGPYLPHKNNPVKENIRSCRSAGTPFYDNETLYRPAQDCTESYGKSITINEIKKLSPEEFEETIKKTVGPITSSPYNLGLHTISEAGNYTLIDGKRKAFIWDNFTFQLKRKFKKILNIS